MKILIIDCGHSLITAGKRCMKKLDANETREWELNNGVAVVLQRIATQLGIMCVRVDDVTGMYDVPLKTRVDKANALKKQYPNAQIYYISIHFNAGANGGNAGGICVKYTTGNMDRITQAKRLYNLLIAHTGLIGNRSNPVGYQSLYVCRNTSMPALLVELGFMDSKVDVPVILTQDHKNKCAQAICDFINTEVVF